MVNMLQNYEQAKALLANYKQEHLLAFYDELNEEEKQLLINQIFQIDFEEIFRLYEASKIDEMIPHHKIEPLPYLVKNQLSKPEIISYQSIGKKVISSGKYAVVTLAGGQGTRLGYKGPKGTFELDIVPKKSLFEILCDRLKEANETYHTTIPWYIMTSHSNDQLTKEFFKEKKYFGYPKEYISFFQQAELPLIDVSGNLILEETYKIKEASNGNGDVFASMKRHRILQNMKQKQIEWVFFSGVDNVTLEIVDPLLLGLTLLHKNLVASKSLFKKDVNDKDWVFAKKNGKPSIMNSCHLTDTMKIAKNEEGNYLYREINMLAHLFHISALEKVADSALPYHRAFKKNTFVNEEGMKQVPEDPNTFKFETFIFDAFSFFDSIELLRVEREEEFAPIKDFTSIYNPESAKELYERKYRLK